MSHAKYLSASPCGFGEDFLNFHYTIQPVNKRQSRETGKMAFVHRWPLFGGSYLNTCNNKKRTCMY